jgi:hypothetical protein
MSAFGSLTDINRVSSVRRSNALRNQCQDFGGKSQDRAGLVVLSTPPAQRSEAKRNSIVPRHSALPNHSRADDDRN